MMGENTFHFPLLSPKALVENINEIIASDTFALEDLTHPQADRIQQLYQHFLNQICPNDMRSSPQFNALKRVTINPELLANSIPLIHLALAMQRVLRSCHAGDFSIQDLVDPKLKRTRRFLSALINFCRFRELRLETFEAVKEEMSSVQQQYAAKLKRINELKERINNIRAQRAEEEAQANQLRARIEEGNSVMANNQRVQQEVQKSLSQTKTAIAEKNARLEQLKISLLNSTEAADDLRKKVVQSPDRLKADIQRMHTALTSVQQVGKEKHHQLVELQSQKDQVQSLIQAMEQGIGLLQGINVEVEKRQNIQATIDKKRDMYEEKKGVLRDVTAKLEHMSRQLESKQEKVAKNQLVHQHTVTATKENIQQTEGKVQELMKKNEKKYGELQVLRENLAIMQQQMEEKENAHSEQMVELKEQYHKMLSALDHYHKQLAETWEQNDPQKILADGTSS